ncbi:hypothetical protein SEA_LILMAC1015_37 [Arthrobacter phage Lilmac1015]|uniref:Uncharacterized protein n=1 Tax=Arthrobacter phage Lilmac1015 TaxID=2912653 RepID=A0AA49H162_9CAUD|nr:hypothetical protein SEA_LILMAC1015_37 [Arthrobacter phage Lilmac1015]
MPRNINPDPIAVYPAGTRIDSIRIYDRSTKVAFTCSEHPGGPVWVSKDPRISSWFVRTAEDESKHDCGCKTNKMVTASEYAPTRNG